MSGASRQADDVERLTVLDAQCVDRVLDPLADDVELPFERHIGVEGAARAREAGAPSDENLLKRRLHRHCAGAERAVVGWHLAPAEHALPLFHDDPLEEPFDPSASFGVAGQEDQTRTVAAERRQFET